MSTADPSEPTNKNDRLTALLSLIGGLALLASLFFGAFLVVVIPIEMWQKTRAESWPAREAVITMSYARKIYSSRSGTRWIPEICVTYVDDQTMECIRRVRYGGVRFGSAKSDTHNVVARYPRGSAVSVHYDPENPTRTVLEARSSWIEMRIAMTVGLAMVLIPLVGILIASKRRKRVC